MALAPRIVRTLPALRRAVERFEQAGERIALVPTMAALHEGHLSLVRLARRRARRTIVSIFVNPAQFAPTEDFVSYPRNLKVDLLALAGSGVDLAWVPRSWWRTAAGRSRGARRCAGSARVGFALPSPRFDRRSHGRRASQFDRPAHSAPSGERRWTFFRSRWPKGRGRFA